MATRENWAKVLGSFHQYKDSVPVYFGNSKDVALKWDATNLTLKPVADDTGAFIIGDGTTDMSFKVFLGTSTRYVLFDTTASAVTLLGVPFTIGADTNGSDLKLFGATTGNYLLWDASEDDLTLVGTATQLSVAGTTESTSTTTGSLRTAGGFATGGDCYLGDDVFLTSAAKIDWAAGNVTLTHATGALTLNEDSKLQIRDSGIYLQSPADGRLTIAADGTGQTYGVMFMMGAGKSIYISSAIELADQGATNYSNEGAIWFSSVTKKLEWYNSTAIRYVIDSDTDGAVTLTSDLTISGTDKKVYFRNANIWIGSISTTQIQISSPGTTENAIYLTTGTGGGVLFGSYIGAFKTDTNGTEEGQVWYDESENRIKVHCGPDGVKTLAVV